jgi:hypothetical protein
MKRVEDVLGRVATSMVEASRSHLGITLAVCSLLTIASLYGAATMLEVDTDSSRLLSEDMAAGRTNRLLVELFPSLQDNIVVLIEADEAPDARDTALELRELLAAQPERYPEVFLPGHGDYYDDFGIYHLEREELERLAARIDLSGELLATLAERPELPILLGALSHTIASDEGIEALGDEGRRILDRVTAAVRAFREGGHAPIDWDDLLFEDVDAGHTNPQLLFVKPVGDLTQLEPVLAAVRHIRGVVPELEPRPGLRVRVTGDRATHAEEMSLIIREVGLAGGASLLLVTGVLFYCLRSLRLVLATVLTLVVGLAWTSGFAAVAVGRLNALTSAFAVVYIGLGVDFGIHFAMGLIDRRDAGASVEEALRETSSSVGSSLFLCAITTAIGFYAFIPTDYSAVVDMGIISGTGVFLGLIATLTFFPALIALGLGGRPGVASAFLHRVEIAPPTFPVRYPRAVCGVAALLAIVCSIIATGVRFEFSTLKVRDPRVESVAALEDLLNNHELSVWTVDVIAPNREEAAVLAAELEQLEGVEQVRTAYGFLPEDQEERLEIFRKIRADLTTPVELTEKESGATLERMKAIKYTIEGYSVALDLDEELRGGVVEGDAVWDSAQDLRSTLIELLDAAQSGTVTAAGIDLLEADIFGNLEEVLEDITEALPTRTVTIDDLPSDLMSRYVAADGRTRVEVFSDADLNDHGELERFSDLIQSVHPEAGGPVPGAVALGRAMISSLREALITAVVAIALGLLLLWRSLRYTLFTLAPLAIGSIGTAAVSVLADVPFNFANVIVLPLILGIGVDSGIHLVHRHRSGLDGAHNLLATSTARAVLFSALTTWISFATLALSNHLGIASLAKLLCVGILLMLLSNMIVLPALLTWLDGPGESDRSSEPS